MSGYFLWTCKIIYPPKAIYTYIHISGWLNSTRLIIIIYLFISYKNILLHKLYKYIHITLNNIKYYFLAHHSNKLLNKSFVV